MKLILASHNAKKLAELRGLLSGQPGLSFDIVSQSALGIAEADEPFHSFVENALAKARHAALASGCAAIADDSGLCVGALRGAPGVISAHFGGALPVLAGEARELRRRRQDARNNTALLAQMQGQPDRRAHFISTLVALRHVDDPEPLVAVGRWSGVVLEAPRGEQGFGYDPLMFIPELDATVAELDAEAKNRHSHRARAAVALRAMLVEAWHLRP